MKNPEKPESPKAGDQDKRKEGDKNVSKEKKHQQDDFSSKKPSGK